MNSKFVICPFYKRNLFIFKNLFKKCSGNEDCSCNKKLKNTKNISGTGFARGIAQAKKCHLSLFCSSMPFKQHRQNSNKQC